MKVRIPGMCVVVLMALLCVGVQTSVADYGPFKSPFTGVSYILKTDRGTYDQSADKAVTLRLNGAPGCLAVIHSDAEWRWLTSTFGSRLEYAWLGYSRNRGSVPGPWRAADKSEVDYSSWSNGEPNNTANKEDAIIVWANGKSNGLGWADISRNYRQDTAPPKTGGYLVMFKPR